MTTSTDHPLALVFYAAGIPAPQGSKRHVGGGRMIESSKKVAPWREDVRNSAELAAAEQGWEAPEGPVAVDVTFWLPRPKSHPKTRRTWPTTKPDVDKLLRSTCDALTSAGVIADDARIVDLDAHKRYVHPAALRHDHEPAKPGAHITIINLEGETP